VKCRHGHIQKSTKKKHRHKVRSTNWFNFCHCKCPSGFKFFSALSSCNMTYKPVKQPEPKDWEKGFVAFIAVIEHQHYVIYPLKTFQCPLFFIFTIIVLYSLSLTLFFYSPISPWHTVLSFLFPSLSLHYSSHSDGQQGPRVWRCEQ